MLDAADSLDDRLAMRRARRWRRRGRIVAPFLAVPVMLGLLLLSVDLIEYQPSADVDPTQVLDAAPATPTRPADGSVPIPLAPGAALSVSVVEAPMPQAIAPSTPEPAIDQLASWPGSRSSAERR